MPDDFRVVFYRFFASALLIFLSGSGLAQAAAPTAAGTTVTTSEDTKIIVDLTPLVSNPDGGTLTYYKATSSYQLNGSISITTAGSATFTPTANYNGTAAYFQYYVKRLTSTGTYESSLAAKVMVTVTSVNDAPTITATQNYTVNEDTAKTVTASDTDGDVRTYTVTQAPAHGTCTTSASGVAYMPASNWSGTDLFKYQASDPAGLMSAVATVNMTVTAVNDAPTPTISSATTLEDTVLNLTLTATDPENNTPFTYGVTTSVSNGVVSLLNATTGAVTFTPTSNTNGTGYFYYYVKDSLAKQSANTKVTVTITAVNDAPTATAVSKTLAEDAAATAITLSGSDPENSTLTYSIVSNPGHGTLGTIYSTKYVKYTPSLDYSGADSFTYKVSDGSLASATATVTLTVTPANDAPTVTMTTTSYTTDEDVPVTITLSATDKEGDPLTYKVTSNPLYGTVTILGNQATYTPEPNEHTQTRSFKFAANDGTSDSAATTISITINAVDDPPVMSDLSATVDEDSTTASANNINLPVSDAENDPLTYTVSDPPHGSVTWRTGFYYYSYNYRPDANYNGPDSFTYSACETAHPTVCSNTGTATLTVTPVSDPLDPVDYTATTFRNTAVTMPVAVNDFDGFPITYSFATPAHGTVTDSTYTPTTGYMGEDKFTYQATNPAGTVSGNMTVSVTSSNPPQADDLVLSTEEYSAGDEIYAPLTPHVTDLDGDAITISYGTPENGSVVIKDGVQQYLPERSFTGTDTFTYTASDGGAADTAQVSVTVTEENLTPYAMGYKATTVVNTEATFHLLASDYEDSALTYALVGAPQNGNAQLNGGALTYVPGTDFLGTDTFNYTVSDGVNTSDEAEISIEVIPANVAPSVVDLPAEGASPIATDENVAVTVALIGTDPNGDSLNYWTTGSTWGTATVTGSQLSFLPSEDFNGTVIIKYVASDGSLTSNEGTVTITVNGENTKPVAKNGTMTTSEDRETRVALNASDPEGDALTYQVGSQPQHGSVTIDGDIAVYQPVEDYYGEDAFTFIASDANSSSELATVSLTIQAIVDPVIDCDSQVDASHVQVTASGLEFYDNLINVTLDHVGTATELQEILTTAGGIGYLCKIEQPEMTEDEAAGLIDPVGTASGFYAIEVGPGTEDELYTLTQTLETLSSVKSAYLEYLDNGIIDYSYETDTEGNAYQQVPPRAISNYFGIIQLKGALDYLSAYQNQGQVLSPVHVPIVDTGVCAADQNTYPCVNNETTDSNGIVSLSTGSSPFLPPEFSGVVQPGVSFVGATLNVTAGQAAGFPFGLVDMDEGKHGSNVAALIGAKSNGDYVYPEEIALKTHPFSGILGSVPHLDYMLTSYVYSTNDYHFSQKPVLSTQILGMIYQRIGGSAPVSNHSYGFSLKIFNDRAAAFGWQSAQKASSDYNGSIIQKYPHSLYVFAAGNSGLNLTTDEPDFVSILHADKYANHIILADTHLANTLVVQGTTPGTDVLSVWNNGHPDGVGSNYGGIAGVAAAGDSTSYSAPLVTGTAALLEAINPALEPADLVEIIQGVGRPTDDTGAIFLDTAASVLSVIDKIKPDYVPMNSSFLHLCGGLPASDATRCDPISLGELRPDEGFSVTSLTSGHIEDASWDIDGKVLTLQRYSREDDLLMMATRETEAMPYGVMDRAPDAYNPYTSWGPLFKKMETTFDTIETYDLGLAMVFDQSEVNSSQGVVRKIPVMTVMPKGTHTFTQFGKYDVLHKDQQYYWDESYDVDQATSYCLKLEYGVNTAAGAAFDESDGFLIPLARESETGTYTIAYAIENAKLTANFFSDFTGVSTVNGGNYDTIPDQDCETDVTLSEEDNSDAFAAWKASVQATEYADKSCFICTASATWCAEHDLVDYCESVIADTPEDETCLADGNCMANGNNLACLLYDTSSPTQEGWKTSSSVTDYCVLATEIQPNHYDTNLPNQRYCSVYSGTDDWYQDADSNTYTHMEVSFTNTQCTLSAKSKNIDPVLGSTPDLTVDNEVVKSIVNGDTHYLQTFLLDIDATEDPTCTATATVKRSTLEVAKYYSVAFKNYTHERAPECSGSFEAITRQELEPESFEITWNLNQGEFPAQQVFDHYNKETATCTSGDEACAAWDGIIKWPSQAWSGALTTAFYPLVQPSGHTTPGFGANMEPFHWAHGLGPVKSYDDDDLDTPISDHHKMFRSTTINKTNRTVVP